MKKCDTLIIYACADSNSAVLKIKKVIAGARLRKYKAHTNDHSLQIAKEFVKK